MIQLPDAGEKLWLKYRSLRSVSEVEEYIRAEVKKVETRVVHIVQTVEQLKHSYLASPSQGQLRAVMSKLIEQYNELVKFKAKAIELLSNLHDLSIFPCVAEERYLLDALRRMTGPERERLRSVVKEILGD